MFLSILCALCCALLAGCALLVFAPLRLLLSGSHRDADEAKNRPVVNFSWFHPAILRCDIEGGTDRSYLIVAFNRFRLFSPGEKEPSEEPVVADRGTREKTAEEEPHEEKTDSPENHDNSFDHDAAVAQLKPEEPDEAQRAP
jgi:hypothetical protein